MKFIPCVIAVLSIVTAMSCEAKERPPELAVGMSYSDVLTRAGAPVSKNIMETKRQQEWFYKDFSVLFGEDRVEKVRGSAAPQLPAVEVVGADSSAAGRPRRETPPDLLRNILKELPVPSPSAGAGVPNPPPGGHQGAMPVAIDEP